jgi:hypothetical protein
MQSDTENVQRQSLGQEETIAAECFMVVAEK